MNCYIVNVETKQLKKLNTLPISNYSFYNTSAPVLCQGKIYAISYSKDLVSFDISNQAWANLTNMN